MPSLGETRVAPTFNAGAAVNWGVLVDNLGVSVGDAVTVGGIGVAVGRAATACAVCVLTPATAALFIRNAPPPSAARAITITSSIAKMEPLVFIGCSLIFNFAFYRTVEEHAAHLPRFSCRYRPKRQRVKTTP
jgi:hypothetical protein